MPEKMRCKMPETNRSADISVRSKFLKFDQQNLPRDSSELAIRTRNVPVPAGDYRTGISLTLAVEGDSGQP